MSSPVTPSQKRFIEPPGGKSIGRGSFGTVFQGLDIETGRLVAIKKIFIGSTSGDPCEGFDETKVMNLVAEITLMKRLLHNNIVRYIGTERNDAEVRVYMEYMAGGSLASMLSLYGALPECVCRRYTRDLLSGLCYLHEQKIAHRDIKCENLLLCSSGIVKLSDFGCSKDLSKSIGTLNAMTFTGTPLFMAPEVVAHEGYDAYRADVWTVGVTVLQMVTGAPPFAVDMTQPLQYMLHISKGDVHPIIPDTVSPECREFVTVCLNRDPHKRPSVAQLLEHPFVAVKFGAPLVGLSPQVSPRRSVPEALPQQTVSPRDPLHGDPFSQRVLTNAPIRPSLPPLPPRPSSGGR